MDNDSDNDLSDSDIDSVVEEDAADFQNDDNSSEASYIYAEETEPLLLKLFRIDRNDPGTTEIDWYGEIRYGEENHTQLISDEGWEKLGRGISNNTYLTSVGLSDNALNDHKTSFFFWGLTRSSSIKYLHLLRNRLSTAGVRSMMSFLQNANNLTSLNLWGNNIQSEGFNVLLRALRNSPITELCCNSCGIDSIEIDNEHMPKHLKKMFLSVNDINADGCYVIANLLQGRDATLETLSLGYNNIDNEGVAILVDALQNNTSLTYLYLVGNDISNEGMTMLLTLVNDISSIEATLQSNHTLRYLSVGCVHDEIQRHIKRATDINRKHPHNPEAAGEEKVIQTQLNSAKRAELAELQGVHQSLYSEINPLHLPEVLSLIGQEHGQGELYIALKSPIAGLLSTVNRKECIKQQMAHHSSKVKELGDELATIEAAEGNAEEMRRESGSNKRRRKWWWGLWGGA